MKARVSLSALIVAVTLAACGGAGDEPEEVEGAEVLPSGFMDASSGRDVNAVRLSPDLDLTTPEDSWVLMGPDIVRVTQHGQPETLYMEGDDRDGPGRVAADGEHLVAFMIEGPERWSREYEVAVTLGEWSASVEYDGGRALVVTSVPEGQDKVWATFTGDEGVEQSIDVIAGERVESDIAQAAYLFGGDGRDHPYPLDADSLSLVYQGTDSEGDDYEVETVVRLRRVTVSPWDSEHGWARGGTEAWLTMGLNEVSYRPTSGLVSDVEVEKEYVLEDSTGAEYEPVYQDDSELTYMIPADSAGLALRVEAEFVITEKDGSQYTGSVVSDPALLRE